MWRWDFHEKHRQEINHLVQEVKELSESIRQIIVMAIAARQEDDRALVPLLHSQDAKLELLHQRLYQNGLFLSSEIGFPGKPAAGKFESQAVQIGMLAPPGSPGIAKEPDF